MDSHIALTVEGVKTQGPPLCVRAPYDDSIIATIDAVDDTGVGRALDIAYAQFRDRSTWLTVEQRIAIFEKTIELVKLKKYFLAQEATHESGKLYTDSENEIEYTIQNLQACVDYLRESIDYCNPTKSDNTRLPALKREPIGVVVAISAFNQPLYLVVNQIAPAIAAGCPVIIKPSMATPLSCFRFVEILQAAGLPARWCQAIVLKSHTNAINLVRDPRVAFFSFVGRPNIGALLRSELTPGAKCLFEYGTVAPVFIEPDAVIETTLRMLLDECFYHAGQVNVSVQMVFCHSKIARIVAEQLGSYVGKLKVGDPTLNETHVGPMIHPYRVEWVHTQIENAVMMGAETITGGDKLDKYFYAPTVLYNPQTINIKAIRAIFGPVIYVFAYDNVLEALRKVKSNCFSFYAPYTSVFTRNMATLQKIQALHDTAAVTLTNRTAFNMNWHPFSNVFRTKMLNENAPNPLHQFQVERYAV